MANQVAWHLRKAMTRQEIKLWLHLRSWKARGYHFRRQSPRAGYIADFVCMKHRLVIEIDGSQHNLQTHAAHDARRDEKLAKNGFHVLRFWNSDVDCNLIGVLEAIDSALNDRLPTRPPSAATLPLSGEG